jgi:hypothetical protein
MAKIGIEAGKPFDIDKLGADTVSALQSVPKEAFGKIMAHFKDAGENINGWVFTTKTGVYGTEYLQRATVAAIGLGANRPEDAVYPTSEVDNTGKPYDGSRQYVLHFDKDQLPPAEGFWSLRREPTEPVHTESAQQLRDQPRRIGGSVSATRQSRTRKGVELAPRTRGKVQPHAPPVLAEGNAAVDH